MPLRDEKIQEAYYEPMKKLAIGYYYFCNKYTIEHPVPIPSDDELWSKYMEKLAEEQKLHAA